MVSPLIRPRENSQVPHDSNDSVITLSVTNPYSTVSQSHLIKVYDPHAFSAKMNLTPVGALAGDDPLNLPGLTLRLDASQLSESNGTVLLSWVDSSGAGHPLDRVRGDPVVLQSELLGNKKLFSSMGSLNCIQVLISAHCFRNIPFLA